MDRAEGRTADEDAALDLMVRLIKGYEEEHHPLPYPSPHEMLVYLMEQRSWKVLRCLTCGVKLTEKEEI